MITFFYNPLKGSSSNKVLELFSIIWQIPWGYVFTKIQNCYDNLEFLLNFLSVYSNSMKNRTIYGMGSGWVYSGMILLGIPKFMNM